ncbi:PEP-CTERM sorting domain-containing protein [Aquabacterium sp. A7-Y]|uniref:PEP-CTERM sorting domain-containing protein n=1 Tax=Aquabacterium sp. A7-Y TaxID=1349605 RepID=UPI00223D36DC|nr:PEP-CTERM sorting domain-containing protein [Aquabacterium sp. A7-Y]MCW7540253.1 PEP-CTERM sorting domain-containing protein [Aquabacterium sp. A7-Y]
MRIHPKPKPSALTRALAALALGGLAFAAAPAHATAAASASAGPLEFEVVDLRPDDGQAASYRVDRGTWRPLGSGPFVSGTHGIVEHWDASQEMRHTYESDEDDAFLAPVAIEKSGAGHSSSASASETGLKVSTSLSSAGSSMASAGTWIGFYPGEVPDGYFGLELAPHSQLTVSFDAVVRISDGGLTDGANENASAMVDFTFEPVEPGAGSGPHWQRLAVSSGRDGLSEVQQKKQRMSLTILNDSDTFMHGSLDIDLVTLANVGISPAPEPGTWALMLAGLGGLAAVARRRRG